MLHDVAGICVMSPRAGVSARILEEVPARHCICYIVRESIGAEPIRLRLPAQNKKKSEVVAMKCDVESTRGKSL